ncbi:MAG: response regulator transcription factor [Rhizobiaceae bacterium]|nr:response regulator transcription factor [Rhizobiaceae bacterium]
MATQSVIVCDDHPIFRNGVVHCLNEIPNLEVVAEASDVPSAIAKLQIYTPDILVCDLSLPGQSGFELLQWSKKHMPGIRVIVLSMHTELAFVQRAKKLGAVSFLAKEDAETDLLHAVEQTDGGFYTSQSVGRRSTPSPTLAKEEGAFHSAIKKVTVAEMKILNLLSDSLTNKAIAKELNISPRTVEAHRFNLSDKLDAKGPNKLLELAIQYRNIIRSKA